MALGVGRALYDTAIRTELYLTDERLLQIDRNILTDSVARVVSTELGDLPRLRRAGASLVFGEFELKTDERQPGDMAGDFMENYEWLRAKLAELAEVDETDRPSPTAGDARSPAQRLKEVHDLYRAGILTDDDYAAKRSELMKLL